MLRAFRLTQKLLSKTTVSCARDSFYVGTNADKLNTLSIRSPS